MSALDFINPPVLYLEIGHSSLKALSGGDGLELPLDRLENGRLSASCRERLADGLRQLLKQKGWHLHPRAFCAVGARGVSLRRLALPPSTKEELQRLLALQIESEFPLSPEELAWGYWPLDAERPSRAAAAPTQELLVAAVKRDVLEEYAELLAGCGLHPVFTLGALARKSLCPPSTRSYAILDIGRRGAELIVCEQGIPGAVRVLPWGGENLTRAIGQHLSIGHDEAENLKIHFDRLSTSNGDTAWKVETAVKSELAILAGRLRATWAGQKLFLSGKTIRLPGIVPWLAQALGGGVECERIAMVPGDGQSAAVLGLKKSCEMNGSDPLLVLQLKKEKAGEPLAQPMRWKWVAAVVLLLLGSLTLPYLEALLRKPGLARKLSEARTARDQLFVIDRELGFLQYLKTNQPPYLDAMAVVANAAPPGTRIESLSMNRRGDLSLRAALGGSQQVVEFRSKLSASTFFTAVVAEEQAPAPDHQKVMVRISAQWNPLNARAAAARELSRPAALPGQTPGKERPPERSPHAGPASAETRGSAPLRQDSHGPSTSQTN